MDPYSFNLDTVDELRLRRHIREVLLPYARTHLTSDHVTFTERVVEKLLLQTLERVPMADATSFLLPTEPFEVLMHSLDSLDLALPEERWTVPSECVRYIRTLLPHPYHPQDPPTDKYWSEYDHYTELSLICRPMSSPILSNRARRETPKPGSTNYRASVPRTNSALTAFLDLKPISVRDAEELPAPPMDEVLDLRLKVDSATDARVRSILQAVLVPLPREKPIDFFGDTPNASEFLRHHSLPRRLPSLDSPPLFPRTATNLSTSGVSSNVKSDAGRPTRVSDLPCMLQMASPDLLDGEDGNTDNHHMDVVSGWTTLRFSSPPPLSPHSSNGSGADELWDVFSPGTPATSLMAAKMDEVEIPRVRKIGHKNTLIKERSNASGTADLLTVAKSPGFFITSFISAPIPTMTQTHKPITPQLEGVKSGMHSPRPLEPGQSTSNSLLGQPPSALEDPANGETSANLADSVDDYEEQRFDDVVASIYLSTPQDPLSYIREEKLADKDTILMDVPDLPPPTAHLKELALFPEGMQCFVAPDRELSHLDTANCRSNAFGPIAFLKPVKGVKPLALDLSWRFVYFPEVVSRHFDRQDLLLFPSVDDPHIYRPFNFGKTIPTDEEVAGVALPIQPEDEIPGYRDEKYEKTARVLLDLGDPPISAEDALPISSPNVPRGCEEFGMSSAPQRVEENGHVEYLLTQRERSKASGTRVTPETDVETQDEVDIEQGTAPWSHNGGREDILAQDENLSQHQEHQGPRDGLDPVEYDSRSRTDCGYSFDDLNIDITDNDLGHLSAREFGVPFLLQSLQDDLPYFANTVELNKENIDDQNEDKENVPPRDAYDRQPPEYQPDPRTDQYDWNTYFEFPESQTPSFEPLSFASQSQPLGPPDNFTSSRAQDEPPLNSSRRQVEHLENDPIPTSEHEQTNPRATKRRKLDDLVPASSRDLFSTFIGLRNQTTGTRTMEHSGTGNVAPIPNQTLGVSEQIPPRAPPDDVFDQHTVRLPEHWIPAASVHRYLASMALIQKRALVRELQGHRCRIVLVERYDLGGTDIIIDPDYGVLLVPLLALPAHLDSVLERISRESWRYGNLLLVLEAFPGNQSHRADCSQDARPGPYAYTLPICKAIKKLRRNLGIAEGCGTMNPRCRVIWAFANDVEEAAKFVRCFGEEACAISRERGHGVLWDERKWLEGEEQEGESDLAKVHGMNSFAAFVMLYDRSLETILDLSSEARLADFGQLLGQERMVGLNTVIESRMRQLAPDLPESVVDPEP